MSMPPQEAKNLNKENTDVPDSAPHHQSDTKQLQELQTLDKLVGHSPQEKTDVADKKKTFPAVGQFL